MSKIAELLDKVSKFQHEACNGCELADEKIAVFGRSCVEHHFDWRKDGKAGIISIGQDPSKSTPEYTGVLCNICNRINKRDKSSFNSFDLMKAAIICDWEFDESRPHKYYKMWYVTNAIKHGLKRDVSVKINKDKILKRCSKILKEEIMILQPRLVIAFGRMAMDALRMGGIVKAGDRLVRREKKEISNFYPDGTSLTVFYTYHPSVPEEYLADRYDATIKSGIENLKDKHPNPAAVDSFIHKYRYETDEKRKAMYVLLLHWLELGKVIRDIFGF